MIKLIIGRRLMGKSTLSAFLASRSERSIVFDPRGLFDRVDTLELTTEIQTRRIRDMVIDHEVRRLVITPNHEQSLQSSFASTCDAIARIVQEHPHVPLVFVVDEVRFIGANNVLTPSLEWLLRCSDTHCQDIIFTCHRPKDVPTDVRAIADYWMLFRMTLEHDLRVVADQSTRAAALIPKLADRQFVCWDDGKGELIEYRDPKVWFYPLRHSGSRGTSSAIGGGTIVQTEQQQELF
ncbi:MAG TPA: hypothetical protein VJ842_14370 [Pyrinomonadaceae bacterium]|nr:hypothetical protein [Pyrinomonadaceae bacterium]